VVPRAVKHADEVAEALRAYDVPVHTLEQIQEPVPA
jgi:hypothetical protein